MLIGTLAVVASMFAASDSAAQEPPVWEVVYDRAAPAFHAVEMIDDTNGVATAGGGIFRTTDGGRSWSARLLADGAGAIAASDDGAVWVGGAAGVFWRSTDGGATWTSTPNGTELAITSLAAVSLNEAWAVATEQRFTDVGPIEVTKSALLRTRDGGATWQRVFPHPQALTMFDVEFAGGRGWLIASACAPETALTGCNPDRTRRLFRSDDGGASWTLPEAGDELAPEAMDWVDRDRGYAFRVTCELGSPPPATVCSSRLYRSDDGGATWTDLGVETRPSVGVYIRFVSRERGWARAITCADDCRTEVLQTPNGGTTWHAIADNQGRFSPSDGAFDATSKTLVLPHGGITLFDLETGAIEDAQTDTSLPFVSVQFESRTRGYASADHAHFYRTDDGGRTWTDMPQPPHTFSRIAPVGHGVIWVVGASRGVCGEPGCNSVNRSLDGGTSWEQKKYFGFSALYGVDASDAQRAWVWGDDGLWRTDDGGATWRRLGDMRSGVEFVDRDFGWSGECEGTAGCESSFQVTFDGGVTWALRQLPYLARVQQFIDRNHGWAIGETRSDTPPCCGWAVYRTRDGGRTWQETWRGGETEAITGILFVDALHGWGVQSGLRGGRYDSTIVATDDGGRTWHPELAGASGRLQSIDGRVWLSGDPVQFFGFGTTPRMTIWRRELPGILAPSVGTGLSSRRPAVTPWLIAFVALAGVSAFAWAGLRRR
jgi:photosystem II stability/assembly factor-like uncharacterized protein